jgi:uncharacterized RDD family membrane protein YckC
MKPTSVPKRLAAFFIDYVILILLSFIVAFLFVEIFSPSSKTLYDSAKSFLDNTIQLIPGREPSMFAKLTGKFSFYLTHMKSGIIICGIVTLLYFVYFEQSKWQGTIGKQILKIKVKDSTNKRLSLSAATKRFLLFAAPALLFYFIVFFIYPQCLNIVNMNFHILKLKIDVPPPCMTLFITYTICYLIWFIPIFFTTKRSTFYDMLSKTQVKG